MSSMPKQAVKAAMHSGERHGVDHREPSRDRREET